MLAVWLALVFPGWQEPPPSPPPSVAEPPRPSEGAAAPVPATAAAPPSREEGQEGARRTRLLVLDLEAVGAESNVVQIVNGLVPQALNGSPALEVITARDLRALVALESEREAMGCDTDSCLAEVAGALGAEYVIFGTVGKLGALYIVQLSLFDAAAARPVDRRDVRADRPEDLADPVQDAAVGLVERLLAPDDPVRTRRRTAVATTPPSGDGDGAVLFYGLVGGGIAGALAGAAAAAAGAGLYAVGTVLLNGWITAGPEDLHSAATKNSGVYNVAGIAGIALLVVGGGLVLGGGACAASAFLVGE